MNRISTNRISTAAGGIAALILAACAGRGALPQAPALSPQTQTAPAVPAAAQATDPPILHAGPTPSPTIPSAKALGLPPAIASSGRQIRLPHFLPSFGLSPMDGIKNPSTHASIGLWLPAWSSHALGDAYEAATVREGMNLRNPVYQETWNILYAPTFHPPNGNCLELSTAYELITTPRGTKGALPTYRKLEVYDFCRDGGGFFVQIPMDAAFVQRYVRYWSNGNKTPQYVAELIRDKDERWDAFLYDALTKKWDVIYRSEPGKLAYLPQGVGRGGWSTFEFYYEYGSGRTKPYPKAVPCSHVPPIGASGLRMRRADGAWIPIPQPGHYGPTACSDPHVTPYYHLHTSLQNKHAADLSWKVRTR